MTLFEKIDSLPLRATTKSLLESQIRQYPQHEEVLIGAARQTAECGFGLRDAEDHIFGALEDAENGQ